MDTIKFGTDGWRAIIAKDYTVENVKRVAYATAQRVKQANDNPSIVLGYDCRFGGPLFCKAIIDVMMNEGVTVYYDRNFVSTPMISLACHNRKADLGVIVTASHNPPEYNGYKLKSNFGGPSSPAEVARVEALIPDHKVDVPATDISEAIEKGQVIIQDFETDYFNHVANSFDIETLRKSDIKVAYDAMYGAGQRIFSRLLPNAYVLHGEHNPGFYGQAPEPIHKNLGEFSAMLKSKGDFGFGLATDGDADRIGLYDGKGHFIDAHHILLMLIHILHKKKGLTGKVVIAFSVSKRVIALCKAYGLEVDITKIGFKYIAERMTTEDVLVGGEESGGIAVKGHIPERDGIWDGLVILDYLVENNCSLNDLIDEIYEVTGSFAYNRDDLRLSQTLKEEIVAKCKNNEFKAFGPYEIQGVETIDGFKYNLGNERYLMIRPSGTEPVLRVYAEAENNEVVASMLLAARESFGID